MPNSCEVIITCRVVALRVVICAYFIWVLYSRCTHVRNDRISSGIASRGCSSMVEFQPSKLVAWVRSPSPAPSINALPFGAFISLLSWYY